MRERLLSSRPDGPIQNGSAVDFERWEILRTIISDSSEVIFWTDELGNFIDCNDATCQVLGYSRDELKQMSVRDIDPAITDQSHADLLEHLRDHEHLHVQSQPRCRDGSFIAMDFIVKRLVIEDRTFLYAYGHEIDLDRESRNKVLEALAKGQPLNHVLGLINQLVETTQPGIIASILVCDSAGFLRNGGATRLPDEFIKRIDGIRPGPSVGSCGTAVYRCATVIVENVFESPLLHDFQSLARIADVSACWSEPIFSSDNEVLGTLALYFNNPRVPTLKDLNLMKTYSRLASIAIERERQQYEILRSEIRHRSLVQSTASTTWTASAEGALVTRQPSWESYTGQTWEEYQGLDGAMQSTRATGREF